MKSKTPNFSTLPMTVEAVGTLKSELETLTPYFDIQRSTLGGENRASALLCFSLDESEDWSGGYLENSRYTRFHIGSDGEIEQFTRSYKIPVKFRKCHVKDLETAIKKIKDYFAKVA